MKLPDIFGKWVHPSLRVKLSNRTSSIDRNRSNDSSNLCKSSLQEGLPWLHLLQTEIRLFVCILAIAVVFTAVSVRDAEAVNSGCSGGNCPDVPTDGIRYSNSVDTVNVGDGVPGETNVNPGVVGIHLSKSGGDAPAVPDSITFTTTFVDHDGDGGEMDPTPEREVVADGGGTPILSGGQFIFKTGADTYAIGATNFSGDALLEFLQESAIVPGETVSGSLTVNNPGPNPGDGARFNTSNADGIQVRSTGGKGSNGSCTTILLATWCDRGDRGGDAGSISVNSDGKITVTGTNRYGISMLSQGGKGGNGGGAFGLFASDAARGGNGGDGRNVTVTLGTNSDITTFGTGGHGVFARSRGGDGGNGGKPSGLVALGDKGGNGGDAGEVSITNNGSITTHGRKAYGIYAESIGAGAGSGGGGGGLVAIGGNGGGESDGNKVTVSNSGTIETKNTESFGIFAQSVGGGGGDGGSAGGLISVGGKAGSGGNSDTVKVFNSGTVRTDKEGSIAIFAQSVGGGGGNGGGATSVGAGASVAIGGDGGPGGNGGVVIYNEIANVNDLTAATIETAGNRAHGIQVQSVGGGGGNGGFAFSGTAPVAGISSSFALGGTGGDGGTSKAVTVNEKGTITTGGESAIGIFAQSVGGGGGSGGGSVAASVGGAYNLSVAIGSKGGPGGAGSTATVNAVGNITTTGSQSHAILAQSVGGGGGNGGYSVAASAGGLSGSVGLGGAGGTGGAASTVTVNTSGAGFVDPTISTSGDGAIGILAQSVGGGGGNGGLAGTISAGSGGVGVSLGGGGGTGSRGGTVNVTNRNIMKTTGNSASAIFAQSVGGGGGNGGAALSGTGGVVGISVAVGGSGGAGSNGGTVTVNNFGMITTGSSVISIVDDVAVEELFGNRSYGIFAQSVGGGGGNGGFAISGAVGVSIPNIPGGAAAISVGGRGGGASNGGNVTVNNHGSIETFGLGSHAIFAQSVGGGGGNGGFAGSVAMTVGSGGSVGVAVGGGGSGGGNSGVVNVNTFDALQSIITHADGADGIHAQSVGGGGGDGGFAMSGAFGFGGETNVNVAVAIGGGGGAGGEGNEVNVTNRQSITTFGQNSNGIMAQSIGGGGGNGGMAVSGTLGLSETAGNVGVTVGGGGGTGNFARKVTVNNFGSITTNGTESFGILGQSIGGSGGNGGLALTAQLTGATKTSATVGVSVGGGGGNGNSAGIVDITNNLGSSITTTGFGSHGIVGQSIGGGGGNGGMAIVGQVGVAFGSEAQATKTLNVGVTVGGAGGTGGFGNTVDVDNDSSIEVMGDAASGIVAQSIGGGGGNGGGALNAIGMLTDSTNDDSRSVVATVSIGGGGGNGNHGGAVIVDNTGSITTRGVSGYGVFAQSVGGGGGIGGRANTFSLVVTDGCTLPALCDAPASAKNNFQLGVTIGGNGGGASNGGNVTVNNSGEIETFGDVSDGIYAQSVGGGGGAGGNGILGSGEILPVPVELAAIPVGSVSFYKNLQAVVGGSAGSSGNGGIVEVNNDKNIITRGSNSNGIFAQSIGGGGGVGGKAAIGATGTLGLGGEGGSAGNGGNVTVNQFGGATIETFGVASNGIFAQSVGGGGGIAGNVDRALAADIDTPIPGVTIPGLNVGIGLALGRSGGNGGNGGVVDVDVDGEIITHGDNAAGIFAQSVGGGGGVLGELGNDLPVLSLLSWQIGSAGDAGNSGLVDVNLTGNIITAGNNATGIFAQSAGGTGMAGPVNVTLNSSILTGEVLEDGDEDRGLGSVGILAHSGAVNNANNGNITISINSADGVVRGGRSQVIDVNREFIGVGIWVVDGKDNTITNNGLITTLGGIESGFAILGTGSDATHPGGNETVENFGTIIGNIDLGAGNNFFNNKADGTYITGAQVGVGGTLTNEGKLTPGDDENTLTANLRGNIVQTATGLYNVDLNGETGVTDSIIASGTANLNGEAFVNIINDGFTKPGTNDAIIVSGAGGMTDSGIVLDSAPSVIINHDLLFPNATDAVLRTKIDFSPEGVGINGNQTLMGDYINRIQLAGGSASFAPIVATLIALPDAQSLAAAYNQLTPEVFTGPQSKTFLSNMDFSNAMLSCRERAGEYRFVREGQCRWMRFTGRNLQRDTTSANLGFDEITFGIAGGMQWQISDRYHLGFGLSYENSNLEVEGLSDTEGDQLQGGLILKGRYGATIFSAALSGGFGWYDSARFVNLPVPGVIARSDQGIGFISSHFRIAQAFEQTNWYVLPMIDAGVTYVKLGSFSETGAGAANLLVQSHSEVYFTIQPAVEVGAEIASANGMLIRPFVKAGLSQFVGDSTPEITAVFQGAPVGVAPFTAIGDIDETFGEVTVGFDFLGASGIVLRLNYEGRFSSNTEQHGGSLKIKAPF